MRTQKLRDGGAEILCSVPGTQLDPRDVKGASGIPKPLQTRVNTTVPWKEEIIKGVQTKPGGDAGRQKDPECMT